MIMKERKRRLRLRVRRISPVRPLFCCEPENKP